MGKISHPPSHQQRPQWARHRTLQVGREGPPPAAGPANAPDRLVYLGDDQAGEALEVLALELAGDVVLVIHAMPLREKYRQQYEEAKKWRR